MITKVCTKCGVEKPATNEYFNKHKMGKMGLHPSCKECCNRYYQDNKDKLKEYQKEYQKQYYQDNKRSEYQEQYRQDNKDKIKEYQKQYLQDNKDKLKEYQKEYHKQYLQDNKDNLKEYHKQYLQDNKDKIKEYQKQYRQDNKDKLKEHQKQYRQENPNINRAIDQKRRAPKNQLPATLTTEQWQQIVDDFNDKCAYCGKPEKLTQEHFIPLTKGGGYTHNNIIPACRSCNSSKRDKDFFEWYPSHSRYSKLREKKILTFLNYDAETGSQQLSIGL